MKKRYPVIDMVPVEEEKDVFEYDNVEVLLERAKRKSRQVYFLC